ncbi:PepSY-like domain-containing protein [Psychroflexus salis]|uniref:Putative beta-lactamase-inhibitor-like PepSY-like domain-containing protein n=1 Tax=Psychroflexus salis TaxID=1526574 RepID=A0A917E6B9_9FLAO|nr:PepSY-like domain-containing protein [Psychroflexus salis]GGE07386.1 hypothetical protein GCM10010831_06100 [Psychroflexus salis]
MKFLKKITGILIVASLFSCSSNDDASQNNVNYDTSEIAIKVSAITNSNTSDRPQAKNANLQIDEFWVNISRIEFEFADGFGQGISSPNIDDDHIAFNALPQEIQNYVTENYPNDAFCKAEMEDDDEDPYLYEVELQSGTELYFTENFELFAVDFDDDGCDLNDDDGDDSGDDDDDYKIFGPFEINVSSNQTSITEVDIPVAEYEEVEFEMERNNNPSSPLFQKSMLMTGTLNGLPFEFYHTFSEDFEVDYEDAGQNLVITNENNNEITFQFDLISVVNAVNFDAATDANGDGVIEISPIDPDGNNALASEIKNAIKVYVDLID